MRNLTLYFRANSSSCDRNVVSCSFMRSVLILATFCPTNRYWSCQPSSQDEKTATCLRTQTNRKTKHIDKYRSEAPRYPSSSGVLQPRNPRPPPHGNGCFSSGRRKKQRPGMAGDWRIERAAGKKKKRSPTSGGAGGREPRAPQVKADDPSSPYPPRVLASMFHSGPVQTGSYNPVQANPGAPRMGSWFAESIMSLKYFY